MRRWRCGGRGGLFGAAGLPGGAPAPAGYGGPIRLPASIRRATPARLKHDRRLRALAVGSGLIPPRSMHSGQEAALLARLAAAARRVVEIGVYEGGSAVLLARAMPAEGELHLIDPFGEQPDALRAGWAADARATRRVVERAARSGGPLVVWHVAYSQHVASDWMAPIDLLFIDGDHSAAGCRRDWELFHPHVVAGGRVAFHDARLDHPGGRGLPGPTEVTDALFRVDGAPRGWAIESELDRTLVVRRSSTVD